VIERNPIWCSHLQNLHNALTLLYGTCASAASATRGSLATRPAKHEPWTYAAHLQVVDCNDELCIWHSAIAHKVMNGAPVRLRLVVRHREQ